MIVNAQQLIYLGKGNANELYKVGISNDVERRAKQVGMDIVKTLALDPDSKLSARSIEARLHSALKHMGNHYKGEWFKFKDHELTNLKIFMESQQHLMVYIDKYPKILDALKHQFPKPDEESVMEIGKRLVRCPNLPHGLAYIQTIQDWIYEWEKKGKRELATRAQLILECAAEWSVIDPDAPREIPKPMF